MAAQLDANSTRAKALARRKSMSTGGKAALGTSNSAPAATATPAPAPTRAARASSAGSGTSASSSTRQASLARRKAMSTMGKRAVTNADRTRGIDNRSAMARRAEAAAAKPAEKAGDCGCGCKERDSAPALETSKPRNRRSGKRAAIVQSTAKVASLARRKAQSTRGKAGISKGGMSEAQTARASNPSLSSRELAQAVRNQRSKNGAVGKKKSAPCGRRRKASDTAPGAASDAPWKVGASETSSGQTVTGTMVGRDEAVTGDEASTCRAVTGTEYLGADIFRNFCQSDPASTPQRVSVTATASGNTVTGNKVGRSVKVTGDEPGTCKNVTGTEYVSADQAANFCGTTATPSPRRPTMAETMKGKSVTGNNVGASDKVTGHEAGADRQLTGTQYMQLGDKGAMPPKVGVSDTLRGGSVTGTLVGRSGKTTGDEPGACRNVTGDDYVGKEQYADFCDTTPKATDRKVGVSTTHGGEGVTGTMTGRGLKVTGDEPGTCKAVTGTPYASREQYATYCEAPDSGMAGARMAPSRRNFGSAMTGLQPGVGGKMTGADKGACEAVSGTPYVGSDNAAQACPAVAADKGAPDYPQAIGDGAAPWEDFSTQPPLHASDAITGSSAVTGSQYESGQITGPFNMATGKVTGTEQARFGVEGARGDVQAVVAQETEDGRIKSRITGEGQDAGLKITGDDWERGEHVTGTEGASALRRNPTRTGGPMNAMGFRAAERAEAPQPVSKVTGSSGNTENGSLITYSGGARG